MIFKKKKQIDKQIQNSYSIKLQLEYPFSMTTKCLKKEIDNLILIYDKVYRTPQPVVYISKSQYGNGILSNLDGIYQLIEIGKQELSRRTNESIIKWTLFVASLTLIISIISVFR